MSSDYNTIYHVFRRPYNFVNDLKTVEVVKIGAVEYSRLETQFAIQRQENDNVRSEITSLKKTTRFTK